MPDIDIELSAELEALLELPDCSDIKLPDPGTLTVELPTGGALKAFSDVSAGLPTDCSLTVNLLVQIAPLLASMDCLVKILKLLKPLIDVISGLPMPPAKALADFAKAAVDLAPCLAIPTPAAILPFIRGILCLVLRVMGCFIEQMKTVIEVLGGLAIELEVAQAAGNAELVLALECARDNAETSAQHYTQSIEPVGVILDLVSPLMEIAGIEAIQLPALAKDSDLESLKTAVATIEDVVDKVQSVVDAVGGCS